MELKPLAEKILSTPKSPWAVGISQSAMEQGQGPSEATVLEHVHCSPVDFIIRGQKR